MTLAALMDVVATHLNLNAFRGRIELRNHRQEYVKKAETRYMMRDSSIIPCGLSLI